CRIGRTFIDRRSISMNWNLLRCTATLRCMMPGRPRVRPRTAPNREGCALSARWIAAMNQQPPNGMDPTGAEIVVRALQDQGVQHVFGYPGGAVLPIYDALFQQDKVEHLLVRHEQGAAHAAEGYARSTGKPGVVLVTSGPGATNAITGLADALMDSIPLVCITGQVPTHLIGTDAF